MNMDLSTAGIMDFVVTYKWWFAPLVPVVIAIMVVKARG